MEDLDLTAFARVEELELGRGSNVAAVIGKQACSLGAFGLPLNHTAGTEQECFGEQP